MSTLQIRESLSRRRLLTIAIAAAGGALFLFLHLPLPMLLGPMLACLIAALAGMPMADAGWLGQLMRTILGVAVGASITPQVLSSLPDIAASLIFVPVFIGAIALIGYPLLRRVFGFDHATAWYGAMPGGLQDMLVFGEEAGGDIRALSLIHATRVLVIVTVAPLLMTMFWQVDLAQPPGAPMSSVAPHELGLMIACGYLGWKLAERVNLFGASILGPMILTAALSLAGLIQHRPPAEMIQLAQFFIGIAVGSKYAGITLRELRLHVTAGLVYSLILAVISLGFIEIIVTLGLAPGLDAFLAFLPGGQAEMIVIAIIAGADLAYVVSHHLLRIVLVIVLAPIVARLFGR
ncbi:MULTISPECIES: AbrB family transcriptional regulator [Paracoccus]|jgi:membrane AbrB-like protein|uniref:AbrB family transcriptional regulator n=1 Tax=Paracoccus litorisediminis TaxID=2006130 RepID=A0A844HR89_9RHOB|nr:MULTISPECIES: AbrB family transcriptional regulator [Paracoccus]MBD9529164.1 AbrB family transcriptional regulator [Paracoccus sp. PAR01]MTH62380.1 AbrB family transcriptional regulator [Paracoccus litorisediminis]